MQYPLNFVYTHKIKKRKIHILLNNEHNLNNDVENKSNVSNVY